MPVGVHSLVVADLGVFRIRRKLPADAVDDYAWRRDPELARFDGEKPLNLTFSEFLAAYEREHLAPHADREAFSLEDPSGLHFGNVMYYNVDSTRTSAEFGITIALEGYRNRGLGTDAVVAFVRFLWAATALRRIQLHTLDWNAAARRCFLRAGFEEVAMVQRGERSLIRMEARREWWLLWEMEGRFPMRARGAGDPAASDRPAPSGPS